MHPPHKKKRARIGRPPKTRAQKDADTERYSADGKRLRKALDEFGLSVAKASRVTGLRQAWISQITKGERAFGREDLRAFGKLGISADYLLGAADRLIPPNQTRSRGDLAIDLAEHLEHELATRTPLDSLRSFGVFEWAVDGHAALSGCVDRVASESKASVDAFRDALEFERDALLLWRAAREIEQGVAFSSTKGLTNGEAATSISKQADRLAIDARSRRAAFGKSSATAQIRDVTPEEPSIFDLFDEMPTHV